MKVSDAICVALNVSPWPSPSPSFPTSVMREVGRSLSSLSEALVVLALLPARSVAVPLAVVPVLSTLIVQYVVTAVPPVVCAAAGSDPLDAPSDAVPLGTQPSAASPVLVVVGYFPMSLHVNATPIALVYQLFLPTVPVTTAHVTVGAVLSTINDV